MAVGQSSCHRDASPIGSIAVYFTGPFPSAACGHSFLSVCLLSHIDGFSVETFFCNSHFEQCCSRRVGSLLQSYLCSCDDLNLNALLSSLLERLKTGEKLRALTGHSTPTVDLRGACTKTGRWTVWWPERSLRSRSCLDSHIR